MKTRRLGPCFAAAVDGSDLRAPLGPELEHAIGTSLRAPDEYRLPTTFADVSNLDQHHQVFAVWDALDGRPHMD